MSFNYFFQKYKIFITIGLTVLLGLTMYFYKHSLVKEDIFIEVEEDYIFEIVKDDVEEQELEEEKEEFIVVDIAGAVANPSVYILPSGTRIYEAIEEAGGLTDKADTKVINLAAPLEDGSKLYIPKINETNIPVAANASYSGAAASAPKQININTANSAELQKLSGVGPSTAEKIINYRKEYGPFKKTEDLMNVSGIGEKTFEKLKSRIRVK